MARDHRKLRVFELADQLALRVYSDTAGLPRSEQYGLQAQLRRAAVSVSTNIVEGCSRSSHAEYRRFLEIAHGSSRECSYLLSLTTRLGLLAGDELCRAYSDLAASLLALNRAVQRHAD